MSRGHRKTGQTFINLTSNNILSTQPNGAEMATERKPTTTVESVVRPGLRDGPFFIINICYTQYRY